jgi:serine/threonine-protein kinase
MSTVVAGRYELFGEIASGGMAVVHLGTLLGEGGFARTVAIKRLHAQLARDPEFIGMFIDEAKLASRVRHPNVVPTLDVVRDGDDVLVVMEYVHGDALAKIVRDLRGQGKRVPIRIAIAILTQVLHGLHAAHEATSETGRALGIVHRDVSPHNVIVGADGLARLIDFGVAKAFDRLQQTHGDVLKGKFAYMSPEQVSGRPVDRRTDIWAAGVVLWELLSNRRLFVAESHLETVYKIAMMDIPVPSSVVQEVPPNVDAIVMCALERDPQKRFQTAREMAISLEKTGLVALPTEIAEWMESVAGDVLRQRRAAIQAIEGGRSFGKESARDLVASISKREGLGAGAVTPPPGASTGPGTLTQSPSYTQSVPGTPKGGRAALGIIGVGLVAVCVVGSFFAWQRYQAKHHPAGPASGTAEPVVSAAASATRIVAEPSCPAGMVMVPGGKFFMGSDDRDAMDWEKPIHQVTLTAFCIDTYEVTTAQYKLCSDAGECRRAAIENEAVGIDDSNRTIYDALCNARDPNAKGRHPVNCVSWSMAEEYCRAAGKRLPTEAEWEFAARGRDGRRYPWGDETPSGKLLNACGKECAAWAKKSHVTLDGTMYPDDDGFATTAPVGSFPNGKTPFGAEDMVGNVWEWTSDFWSSYKADPVVDPKVEDKSEEGRVVRGGAWNSAFPSWVRPTFRFHMDPGTKSHGVGFRCASGLH